MRAIKEIFGFQCQHENLQPIKFTDPERLCEFEDLMPGERFVVKVTNGQHKIQAKLGARCKDCSAIFELSEDEV